MSYVITGASGTLGRLAAEQLIEQVDPSEVVLVTRSPGKLADLAERGAVVRAGNFEDPASLEGAFSGGERLLLISTDDLSVDRAALHGNAIDAAKKAGVSFIAYTSIPNPTLESPIGVNPSHLATEKHLADSGLAYTALRNGLYSEMKLPEAQGAVATGKYFNNLGEGRTAYVSRADCAAAAVAVLTSEEELETSYDITGPELLGAENLAAIFSNLTGQLVESVSIDDEAAAAGLIEHGLPAELAPLIVSFGTGIREGYLEQESTAVKDLTGNEPRNLRSVLEPDLAPVPAGA